MKLKIMLVLYMVSPLAAAFEEVEVTPLNPHGWLPANVRDDGLVEHSKNQPLFGDGSLLLATDPQTSGQDKAEYEYLWQQNTSIPPVYDFPQRTLGNVSDLSYFWYRDSASLTAGHFIPVFRLIFIDDAGTADPLDDTWGYLVWEGVYNGINPAATDSWQLSDIVNQNFWVYVTYPQSNSGTIQNFNSTLDDWINGSPVGQPGDPVVNLSANTYIVGVSVGVGSGWGDDFIGYVDAVRVAFGAGDDYLYNFEVCSIFEENTNPDVIFDDSFECFKRY